MREEIRKEISKIKPKNTECGDETGERICSSCLQILGAIAEIGKVKGKEGESESGREEEGRSEGEEEIRSEGEEEMCKLVVDISSSILSSFSSLPNLPSFNDLTSPSHIPHLTHSTPTLFPQLISNLELLRFFVSSKSLKFVRKQLFDLISKSWEGSKQTFESTSPLQFGKKSFAFKRMLIEILLELFHPFLSEEKKLDLQENKRTISELERINQVMEVESFVLDEKEKDLSSVEGRLELLEKNLIPSFQKQQKEEKLNEEKLFKMGELIQIWTIEEMEEELSKEEMESKEKLTKLKVSPFHNSIFSFSSILVETVKLEETIQFLGNILCQICQEKRLMEEEEEENLLSKLEEKKAGEETILKMKMVFRSGKMKKQVLEEFKKMKVATLNTCIQSPSLPIDQELIKLVLSLTFFSPSVQSTDSEPFSLLLSLSAFKENLISFLGENQSWLQIDFQNGIFSVPKDGNMKHSLLFSILKLLEIGESQFALEILSKLTHLPPILSTTKNLEALLNKFLSSHKLFPNSMEKKISSIQFFRKLEKKCSQFENV